MIGLLATYFVVAYLLIPSGLFRSFYSLFLPRIIKFQRTRLEEFTFAILAAILPFSLALALSWTVCVQPFGVQGKSSTERRLAYRTFVAPAINDKLLLEAEQQSGFWSAANQVIRRQVRFLIWYYLLVLLEAYIYARLTANYGLWRATLTGWQRQLYLWIADKVLLPSVSEWYLLLTPFSYPPEPQREVWVDVLSTLDILYQGHVIDHFLDKEGELSGIFLKSPRRFDRKKLLRDIQQGNAKRDMDSYWRDIPSNNLYIPSDKITNLNVRYPTAEELIARRASARFRGEDSPFEVEPAADLLDPVLLPLADLFESNKNHFAIIHPSSEEEKGPLREFLSQQVAEGLMVRSGSDSYRLTPRGYTAYLSRIRSLRGRPGE
jgi:hypothetical protein